jgi:hypothetical protein
MTSTCRADDAGATRGSRADEGVRPTYRRRPNDRPPDGGRKLGRKLGLLGLNPELGGFDPPAHSLCRATRRARIG